MPTASSDEELPTSSASGGASSARVTIEGYRFSEGELEWARQHLGQMRRTVRGNRLLYSMLALTFTLGLIVYLLSFAISGRAIEMPSGWFAEVLPDFLYNLGIVLWTSVILVFFLEVVVDIQRKRWRRYIQLIEKVSTEQGMAIPTEAPLPEEEADLESRMDAILSRLEALERGWKNTAPDRAADNPNSTVQKQ